MEVAMHELTVLPSCYFTAIIKESDRVSLIHHLFFYLDFSGMDFNCPIFTIAIYICI